MAIGRMQKPLPKTKAPAAWTKEPETAPPQSGGWRAWANGGHRRWKPRATPPPPPPTQSGGWRAWAHGGDRRWKPRATTPPPPPPAWK